MLRLIISLLMASLIATPALLQAEDALPVALIRIPESLTSVFVAETSTARLHRFRRAGNGLVHSGSFYMSIGQNGPGKERAGDRRTPLGVYFITEQLDTSKLHKKYGSGAFPLDYPNAWDQRLDREGDGIWLHGVHPQLGQRPERDTDGCIALANRDLLVLEPEFEDNVTPVLVTREVEWRGRDTNDALRKELESRVEEWAASQGSGDLFTYLSLYADDFRRWGMDKEQWSSLRLQTSLQQPIRGVTVSGLLLLAYPDEDGLYLSRFRQSVKDGERETVSTARLYWRRDASGVLKIIAEDVG